MATLKKKKKNTVRVIVETVDKLNGSTCASCGTTINDKGAVIRSKGHEVLLALCCDCERILRHPSEAI